MWYSPPQQEERATQVQNIEPEDEGRWYSSLSMRDPEVSILTNSRASAEENLREEYGNTETSGYWRLQLWYVLSGQQPRNELKNFGQSS
jgi:hypothetical protein